MQNYNENERNDLLVKKDIHILHLLGLHGAKQFFEKFREIQIKEQAG